MYAEGIPLCATVNYEGVDMAALRKNSAEILYTVVEDLNESKTPVRDVSREVSEVMLMKHPLSWTESYLSYQTDVWVYLFNFYAVIRIEFKYRETTLALCKFEGK